MKASGNTRAAVLFSIVGILCGCGGGSDADFPDTAPVTGVVKLDGQPVEGAQITLNAVDAGPNSYAARATSAADGTFEVYTYFSASQDVSGAVPGTYQVSVVKYRQPTGGPASHDAANPPTPPGAGDDQHRAMAEESGTVLPQKYASPSTSGLEITVVEGQENTLPLELTSE